MRRFLGLAITALPLFATTVIPAAVGTRLPECHPPKALPITNQGDVYRFQFSVDCSITIEGSANPSAGVKVFTEYYSKDPQVVVHSSRASVEKQGMTGNFYDATEKFMDPKIDIRSDIYVLSKDDTILVTSNSKKVDGSGNSSYTKRSDIKFSVQKQTTTTFNFTLNKDVYVEKPFLAPTDYFKREASDGISKNVKTMARDYSVKVARALNTAQTQR